MSSFPLLNLPLLVLREIADIWNPLEILNFSLISKRTKQIAKSISHTASKIILDETIYIGVDIVIPDKTSDTFLRFKIVFEKRGPDQESDWTYEMEPYLASNKKKIHIFIHLCNNPLQMLSKFMEQSIEVFKATVMDVYLVLSDIDRTKLLLSIKKELKIQKMKLTLMKRKFADLFFKNFQNKVESLRLHFHFGKPLKLDNEISWPRKTSLYNLPRESLGILKSINSEELTVNGFSSTNKHLNSFLRSWQSGKTNSNLKRADFTAYLEKRIVFSKILKKIEFNHRDPRVVKRDVKFNNIPHSIMGGIDIDGPNGKTGTIDWVNWNFGEVEGNDESTRIDDYERFQRNGINAMTEVRCLCLFVL